MSELGISNSYLRDLMDRVQGPQVPTTPAPQETTVEPSSESFLGSLQKAMGGVNEALQTADKAAVDLATGKSENIHGVLIQMEKAEIALRTASSVRNKIIEAYQEIMRMPV